MTDPNINNTPENRSNQNNEPWRFPPAPRPQQAPVYGQQTPAYSPQPPADDTYWQQAAPAAPQQPNPAHNDFGNEGSQYSYGDSFHRKPKERKKLLPAAIVLALVSALIGGGIGGGIVASANAGNSNGVTISSDGNGTITSTSDKTVSDLSKVVSSGLKSVVTVSAVAGQSGGTGSGVVLNVDDGYIVTNAHVATLEGVSANATLNVQTSTGDTYSAKLVGYDATADLAVLKVSQKMKGVQAIKFANSENLEVGTGTIAIGSPLGLSGTVTTGIVSSLNRPITVGSSQVQDDTTQGSASSTQSSIALSVIQTDAAINPGNSGGALLDDNGNLIGLNVAIASASQTSSDSGNVGVGFAIPSDYVKRISAEIIANGKGTHGFLGVNLKDATSTSSTFTSGAELTNITADGAADKAGLQSGDVVTKVDDTPIASASQLASIVKQDAPGTKVTVTYTRGGTERTTQVTLTNS